MKQSDIAAAIERDLLRSDAPVKSTQTTKCFSCGYSITANRGRLCSERCREWFDAGNPSFEDQRQSIQYGARPGVHGFRIRCLGCQKEFESRGLRCCSVECDRQYRERRDNLAVMAEAGIEPAPRRICERAGCNARIPKWRDGKRVPKSKRFCSATCAAKARSAKIPEINR